MLVRLQIYKCLNSYIEAFETCYKVCSEKNDYSELFHLLMCYKESIPKTLVETRKIKVETHNARAMQIYTRAYEDAVRVFEKVECKNPTSNTVLTDVRLIIGIFSVGAMKIEKLTTTQIKYFDSVLGMLRKRPDIETKRERLQLIDAELEKLND